jgi:hypothetical protein
VLILGTPPCLPLVPLLGLDLLDISGMSGPDAEARRLQVRPPGGGKESLGDSRYAPR